MASWILAFCVPVIAAAEPPAQRLAGEGRPLDAATMAALGITESPVAEAARSARPVAPESGTWSWTPGQYSYDGSGNITAIGTEASFLYDVRGRLVDATLTRASATEHREYIYDSFGNRTSMTVGGSSSIPTPTSTATNHLTGLNAVYDAAGNVTQLQPPGQSTVYQQKFDALNTLQEVKASNVAGTPTQLHIYTADDERLWTFDLAANASHWKIRDLDGKVVRDYYVPGTSWNLSRDYIYRDGALLAAVTPAETLHFSLDHLGTPRVITGADRSRLGFHYYLPFGEEWTDQSGAQEGEPMKFTGHERDPDAVSGDVDGFDYMHARYYSANVGRFLSVDPVLDVKRSTQEPQSWNRYSYVINNPINRIDPDGRMDGNGMGEPLEWICSGCSRLEQLEQSDRIAVGTAKGAAVSLSLMAGGAGVYAFATNVAFRTAVLMNMTGIGIGMTAGVGVGGSQIHHIATNKNIAGGFTAQFTAIFSKAGMKLSNPANLMPLAGHAGAHGKGYHQLVLRTLQNATAGLSGEAYKKALIEALRNLRMALEKDPNLVKVR